MSLPEAGQINVNVANSMGKSKDSTRVESFVPDHLPMP